MLASHQWLKELTGLDLTPQQMADAFTSGGLEVEGLHEKAIQLDRVIVVEVRGQKPHPTRDNLKLVSVFDGAAIQEIVCGASNVPAEGRCVLLAQLGARLPNGVEIAERKLGGVASLGMLCGETELDIGSDDSGLLVLDEDLDVMPGQLAVDALGLRDTVLEIGVAPNRPDCLGHIGLARELCAVVGQRFSALPKVMARLVAEAPASLWPQTESTFQVFPPSDAQHTTLTDVSVSVELQDAERCPRYGAALVDAVTISPSPFHVRYRLHVLGLRAISNVVDATNLILLGFGHPIHAFDLDKVAGSKVVVRRAKQDETMQTLDGVERKLTVDDLLICDAVRPVALAGVMGGAESEISASTRRVLIECAVFEPRGVRRTSRRCGMHTDSSHRFERGVDTDDVRVVLAHAAAMIANLSGGHVLSQALDVQPAPVPSISIDLRGTRLNALLGASISMDEAQAILVRLGCSVAPAASGLRVTPPSARPDLTREVDLIEEVARIHGYDQIPTQLPLIAPSSEGTPALIRFVRKLRESAASAGLNEAVNYAFVSPRDLQITCVPTQTVELANPMSEERSVLRTSLLPGLLADLQRAQRHQVEHFAQFEVARVFAPQAPGELPQERIEFGVLLSGTQRRWIGDGADFDVYDLKGVLEETLGAACGAPIETRSDASLVSSAKYLHPGRSALLLVAGVVVGRLGEIHPDVATAMELTGRAMFAELDVAKVCEVAASIGLPRAKTLPRFPASVRDLAVVVPETQTAGQVADLLREAGGALVEAVALFDIYRGEPVEKGSKSLAFRVVYRDLEATLTDKVVEKAHARLVQAAAERFGAKLRESSAVQRDS